MKLYISFVLLLIGSLLSCSRNIKCETGNKREDLLTSIIKYTHDSIYRQEPLIYTGNNFYLAIDTPLPISIISPVDSFNYLVKADSLCKLSYVDVTVRNSWTFHIDYLSAVDSVTYNCKISCGRYSYNLLLLGRTKPLPTDDCQLLARSIDYVTIKKNGCDYVITRISRSYY